MDFKALSDPIIIVGDNAKKPGIFNKIRPPLTNFFKDGKFLGGALTVFLLFAVGLGVYLSQKPTQLAPRADEPQNSYIPEKTASPSASLKPN